MSTATTAADARELAWAAANAALSHCLPGEQDAILRRLDEIEFEAGEAWLARPLEMRYDNFRLTDPAPPA